MPLPQFLRYRLAKRGIIQTDDGDKVQEVTPNEEEVIAEDYDTPRKGGATDSGENIGGSEANDTEVKSMGHQGCPNKCSIYHECSNFCKEKWGAGHGDPDPKYLRLKLKMLQKYPLPITWTEVYDPGTGRYYYWDYESDYVSWLPPMHPRALITEPANLLRHSVLPAKDATANGDKGNDDDEAEEINVERPERHKEEKERKREGEKRHRDEDRRDEDRRREGAERSKSKLRKKDSDEDDGKSSRSKEDKERKREGSDRPRPEDRHREDKERSRGKGYKGGSNDGSLDPMDPAAYSDAPRGTWSTGLERKNEAKTGADTTAAGPLYQMRPYPSPGDVLRANKSSESREGHKSTKSSRRAP